CFLTITPAPSSSRFPYTTLFRSELIVSRGWCRLKTSKSATWVPFGVTTRTYWPARTGSAVPWPCSMKISRRSEIFIEQGQGTARSEEHTSELQSRRDLVCRPLLE